MKSRTSIWTAVASVAAVMAAGCGSSTSNNAAAQHSTPAPQNTPTAPPSTPTTSTKTSSSGPGALSAEANATGTGDIPDNQVFLVFTNKSAGYSMKYPEGWTQKGSGKTVSFSDKNNLIRVVIASGPSPTTASVAGQLRALKRAAPSLTFTAPHAWTLPSGAAVKATYRTQSAPNPVTLKRVTLVVDRYVVAKGGKVATIDLGTPVGVDNVDAYRLISESFHWL